MAANVAEVQTATVQLGQLTLKPEDERFEPTASTSDALRTDEGATKQKSAAREAPKLYEIRDAGPGRGLGAFAIKPIKRGTRILAEAPLLTIGRDHYLEADIQRSFDKLSPENKAKYFTLASNHGQDPRDWPNAIHPSVRSTERQRIEEQHDARCGSKPTLLSIFQTNCMEHEGGAAVFMDASRFNHSCVANAFFSWNSNIGKETIHAMADIGASEEITLCYCDALWDTDMRNWALKHYGFRCDCPACGETAGSFAEKSHTRRYRMRELQDKLEGHRRFLKTSGRKGAAAAGVADALEMCALAVEEGLHTAELARAYEDLAVFCEEAGDFVFGHAAACKALEVYKTIVGDDHPEVEGAKCLVQRLKKKLDGKR